jgi:hypothetical protein
MSNSFAIPYTDFRVWNAAMRNELCAGFDGVSDSG